MDSKANISHACVITSYHDKEARTEEFGRHHYEKVRGMKLQQGTETGMSPRGLLHLVRNPDSDGVSDLTQKERNVSESLSNSGKDTAEGLRPANGTA